MGVNKRSLYYLDEKAYEVCMSCFAVHTSTAHASNPGACVQPCNPLTQQGASMLSSGKHKVMMHVKLT